METNNQQLAPFGKSVTGAFPKSTANQLASQNGLSNGSALSSLSSSSSSISWSRNAAYDSLGIPILSNLLTQPVNVVIKFIHERLGCLTTIVYGSFSNDYLNVLMQIIGSKICQNSSVPILQAELIATLTVIPFLSRLHDYVNWLMRGQGSASNFGNNLQPPYCSTMKVISSVLTYFAFLLTPTIHRSFSVPFENVIPTVVAVRYGLSDIQNTGKVKPFSRNNCPSFQSLQSAFKKINQVLTVQANNNNNKELPRNMVVKVATTFNGSQQSSASLLDSVATQRRNVDNPSDEPFGISSLQQMLQQMSVDQVLTFIHARDGAFSEFISQQNIPDNHLNLLVQIISGRILKNTALLKIQMHLLRALSEEPFQMKLLQYASDLLRSMKSANVKQQSYPYCSANIILKYLFNYYNFALIYLEDTLLENIKSNIVSVYNTLTDTGSCGNKIQPSAANLLHIQRLLKLYENLFQTYDFKTKISCNNQSHSRQVEAVFDDESDTQDSSSSRNFLEVETQYTEDYNFMNIRDVPSNSEVSAESGPLLNPMPLRGSHSSAFIYLKDLYRLLREDFVAPLRQFLNNMIWKSRKFNKAPKQSSQKVVRFYRGVRVYAKENDCSSSDTDGIVQKKEKACTLRFSFPILTEEEWEDNDWLLPESLVILSSDRFRTIYIATVAYRSESRLAKGLLTVFWEGPQPPVLEGVTFLMAESEAYFVSYRYTLKALQIMAQPVPPDYDQPLFSTYPMAKYIVDMSTNQVPPPKYLRNTAERLNFAALTQDMMDNGSWEADPCDFKSWPLASEIGMDAAQYSAFQSAVTQELSIIQGPPGTGKTYIGLQLMKLFLSNPLVVQSPILIVCRTNHALDQFLEGVIPIMENLKMQLKVNLLRVGGGSKSELLGNYIVRQRRIKKDLKRFHKAVFTTPMPSWKNTAEELMSLQKQAEDLKHLLQQLTRVDSITEIVKFKTNADLKKLLDPNYFIAGPVEFLSKAENCLKEHIAVLNATIGILRDQNEFRGIVGSDNEYSNSHAGKVIGMTTTGAAKYTSWLRVMKPKIVIVEEAAEVLESHIVTSITENCEHLILIGDHKQLRPLTTVHKLATDFHLDISLFERLIKNNLRWSCLETQHRMRPEFCRLLVPTIYEKLKDHPDVMNYPNIAGFHTNLFFINHKEHEIIDSYSVSQSNEYEARYLIALCRHVVLQDYQPEKVTILIMYNGQKLLVEELLKALGEPFSSVKVETVDSYQGEENDIIILSLVRSNTQNNIGFLKTENRICVALSRAKHGFYILGNMTCLVKSKSKMWAKISAELLRQGSIGEQLGLKCQIHKTNFYINTPEDFQNKSPEGGCSRKCNKILPNCDHRCPKFCHVVDRYHVSSYRCVVLVNAQLNCGHFGAVECNQVTAGRLDDVFCESNCGAELECGHLCEENCHGQGDFDHKDYQCRKQCVRSCGLGHPCATYHLCFQDCQPCKKRVSKTLPCGHVVRDVECFTDVSDLKSRHTLCNDTLPSCKHRCAKLCHKNDRDHLKYKCGVIVSIVLSCGHTRKFPCHEVVSQGLDELLCDAKCGIKLNCGHTCIGKCHSKSDPYHVNYDCLKQCMRRCKNGHLCSEIHDCFEECEPCEVQVDKVLPCGHIAESIPCFKDVILCEVDVDKLLPCGHTVKICCFQKNIARIKCSLLCGKRLRCGHVCPQKCHVDRDPNHEFYKCTNLCRSYCVSGHGCPDVHPCFEGCRPCFIKVDVKLPYCSHRMMVSCFRARSPGYVRELICYEMCLEELPCGHLCYQKCHKKDDYGDHYDIVCKSPCNRSCEFGHPCVSEHRCFEDCEPCKTCKKEKRSGCVLS